MPRRVDGGRGQGQGIVMIMVAVVVSEEAWSLTGQKVFASFGLKKKNIENKIQV